MTCAVKPPLILILIDQLMLLQLRRLRGTTGGDTMECNAMQSEIQCRLETEETCDGIVILCCNCLAASIRRTQWPLAELPGKHRKPQNVKTGFGNPPRLDK